MSIIIEDNIVYGKETTFDKIKTGELFVYTYEHNNKTMYLSTRIKIGPKTAIGMGDGIKEKMDANERVTLIDKISIEQFGY